MTHDASVPAPTGTPAGLARRLAAVLYELLVLAAVVFIAGFLTLPFVGSRGPASGLLVPTPVVRALVGIVVVGALAAYSVHFWTAHRRTLAMKTWSLRLVQRDGTPVDPRHALARYVAAWIGPAAALAAYALLRPHPAAAIALPLLGLNFAWALVDPERLFLHDRLAGTVLVRDPPRR